MKKNSKLWPLVTLVVVLGGGWVAKGSGVFGEEKVVRIEGAAVMRGPLRISVVERGNIKAANSHTLKSEIEGRSTVLYLIDEGSLVEEGDLLCELDTKEIADNKVQQEISVQNAYASYTKAQQNFEIQESQNTSDIARAEQEVRFAHDDLAKYLEGEMPQDIQNAEEEILVRDQELTLARQNLEWSEKLAAKGFLEQTQLDADRISTTRSEVALAQANRAKALLEDYEIPRRKDELNAAVEESIRELDRVKLQAKARIADYQADLITSKAKYDLEVAELEKMVDQLAKAKLYAPVGGMVVYGVESNGRWGGGEPMKEGAEVRERQEIITIPSEDGYVAEASLHESVLEKVVERMPCFVTVDALRTTLRGEIKFKAVLPDQQSWYANPDLRVYRTEVSILDRDPRVRPGMSCSIEILVDDLPDATYMPVQSVFLDGGAPVALVRQGNEVEKRPIEVGQNNGKWVEVLSGVTAGEIVLLSQPPNITLQPASEEPDLNDREGWPEGRPAVVAPGRGRGRGGDEIAVQPAEEPSAGETRGMERGGFDMEKWKQENPDQAKSFEEAMKDPEKMRQMREQFRGGGGRTEGGERRSGGDRGDTGNRGGAGDQ